MLRDFKTPDVKGPRYRKKVFKIVNPNLLTRFISKYPEYEGHSFEELFKIVKLCHEAMWQTTLDYRDGVDLPENIGSLFIGSCPALKTAAVDYNKSKKYNKIINHSNFDTDGRIGKIFYTNRSNRSRFANREFWSFTAYRTYKRSSAKAYKEDFKKYIDIDHNLKINMLYKKSKVRDIMQEKNEREIKSYNEFDMD